MRAPCLKQGGTIGICSPSHIAEYNDYQNQIHAIRSCGFQVREGKNLYKSTHAMQQHRKKEPRILIN